MGKSKIIIAILVTAAVTAIILIGGFWLWFNSICTPEMTLVQLSSGYRAAIPGKPDASARLYSLGCDRYLLVLIAKCSKHPEGYYLDLFNGKIGLPDFPDYIPLLKYALVDRRIYDGFPKLGAIKADWSVKNDRKEVHIRIKGFKIKESGNEDDEEWMKETLPIVYQSEIVLTKTHQEHKKEVEELLKKRNAGD